jgi:hypothetical protein
VSEPQKRTFATRTPRPSLAPHAEKVTKTNINEGAWDMDAQ